MFVYTSFEQNHEFERKERFKVRFGEWSLQFHSCTLLYSHYAVFTSIYQYSCIYVDNGNDIKRTSIYRQVQILFYVELCDYIDSCPDFFILFMYSRYIIVWNKSRLRRATT